MWPALRASRFADLIAQAGLVADCWRRAQQRVCQPSCIAAEEPAQETAELLAKAVVQLADLPQSIIPTCPVASMMKFPGCLAPRTAASPAPAGSPVRTGSPAWRADGRA